MWDRTYVLHHVATSRFLGTRPRNPYEGMPLSSGAMEEAVTEDSAATLAGAEAVPAGTALAPKAQRNAIPSIRGARQPAREKRGRDGPCPCPRQHSALAPHFSNRFARLCCLSAQPRRYRVCTAVPVLKSEPSADTLWEL
eukprot:175862-Prymnesium_polylepis.1